MTEKALLHLIELYLNGETTLAQERELREALLDSESDDPRVEECLAVMAFAAADGRRRAAEAVRPRRRTIWPSIAVAASLAILLSVGLWINRPSQQTDCSSIIACVETNDPMVAMALMDAQLEEIGMASDLFSESIEQDIASLSEAINV